MRPDRYLRHRQIPGFDQDDLQRSRVAVIGAGAVGNEAVKNLVLLGVGHVDVFDLDRVEPHNLTRSVLLREADIGASKAESVARRATDLDPNVRLHAIDGDIRDTLGPLRARSYRAIIGALDNFEARLALNQLCWNAGVDWINAAIDSRHVSVERFAFGTAAATRKASSAADPGIDAASGCYECTLPASAYARIAERQSCGGLLRAAAAQRVMPTTTITASLAGAQAVNQMLRGGPESTRWLFDTHAGTASNARITRSGQCPCCADEHRALAFVAWPRLTGADLANRLAVDGSSIAMPATSAAPTTDATHAGDDDVLLQLSDRIVVECRCPACGFEPAHGALRGRRASAINDSIVLCPTCREPSVQATVSDMIGLEELRGPLAGHTLQVRYAIASGTGASASTRTATHDVPMPTLAAIGIDFTDAEPAREAASRPEPVRESAPPFQRNPASMPGG